MPPRNADGKVHAVHHWHLDPSGPKCNGGHGSVHGEGALPLPRANLHTDGHVEQRHWGTALPRKRSLRRYVVLFVVSFVCVLFLFPFGFVCILITEGEAQKIKEMHAREATLVVPLVVVVLHSSVVLLLWYLGGDGACTPLERVFSRKGSLHLYYAICYPIQFMLTTCA